MKSTRRAFLIFVLAAMILFSSTAAFAFCVTGTQITDNTTTDTVMGIDGDYLLRAGIEDGDFELYLHQISTGDITQITDNTVIDQNASIDGDYIVWTGEEDGDKETYLYQISTGVTTQLSNNTTNDIYPFINGDYVTWMSSIGDYEIMLYQISTATTLQVTENEVDDWSPWIDGNFLAFLGVDVSDKEVFLYEIDTETTVQITHNEALDITPKIDGDIIAWVGYADGDQEIYFYQISTETTTQISNNTASDGFMKLEGDNIVWAGNEDGDYEIYLYQIGTATTLQLTNNTSNDYLASINGDYVYWDASDGNDHEIIIYQISTGAYYQLTNNSFHDRYPIISGNQIAWKPDLGGDFEIYLGEIGFQFEDQFETADFSLWTWVNTGGGWLYPCGQAAINGSWGACIERGDNDRRKQLIYETPVVEKNFLVRFNLDINSLSMSDGERFRFMQVKMGTERPFLIVLRYKSGQYYIKLHTLLDDTSIIKTAWYPLSDAPHTIEVDWQAAGAPDLNDGFAELYIDDVLQEALTGLDNDTIYLDCLKIGFTSRLEGKSISGIFFVDDVATSNFGHIGLP